MESMTVNLLPFMLLVIVSYIMLCHLIIPGLSKMTNIKMFKQLKEACDNITKSNMHTLVLLLLSFVLAYFLLIMYDTVMSGYTNNEHDDLEKILSRPVLYQTARVRSSGQGDRYNDNNPFAPFMNKVLR